MRGAGSTRQATLDWCRRHASGGDTVLAGRRRGRRREALTRAQELDLIESLRSRYPDDLGLPGTLWTRQSVTTHITRIHGITPSVQAVSRYLRNWGLATRTPIERACALCAGTVARWLDRGYPLICEDARAENASVWWIGRTRLIGLAPATDFISAVTPRGNLRFAVTTRRRHSPLPVDFLDRLAAHESRPIHAIIDGSWSTTEWPRRVPPQVALHPMPSCERRRP